MSHTVLLQKMSHHQRAMCQHIFTKLKILPFVFSETKFSVNWLNSIWPFQPVATMAWYLPKQLCTLVPDKPTELVCRPALMCMPCPTCKNVSKFGHKIGSLKGHPWVAFFCFLWYNSLIIPLSNATWFGSLFLLVPKLHGFKGSRGQSVWIWPRWELKS